MYSVEFEREQRHWNSFVYMAQSRSSARLSLIVIAMSIIGVLAVIELLDQCETCEIDRRSLVIGILIGVVCLSGDTIYKFLALRKQARRDGTILGSHKVTLSLAGVEVAGPSYSTQYAWKAFDCVTVGKLLIVLWNDNAAGVSIPIAAFSSSEDQQAFKRFADDRIEANRAENVLQ
jgi:hypothetical protein